MQLLAGDKAIAVTTLNIPHPYEDGMAEKWIGSHQDRFEKDIEIVFAITIKGSGELIGAIGLTLNLDHESAELGYWVGKPFWDHGYCTEAAQAVLHYAFIELRLNRIHARHFSHNPASGRVMQKVGMKPEGHFRQNVKKWGQFIDSEFYGVLRSEFELSREIR